MFLHFVAVGASLVTLVSGKAAAPCMKSNHSDSDEFGPMFSEDGEETMFNLINGDDADIQRFPFYGMIVKKEIAMATFNTGAKLKLFCGSSLIHPKFILTAFHCFKKRPYPEEWVVVFNVVNRCHPVGFRAFEIANVFFHMGSTTSAQAKINDLSLAELKNPVTDTAPVKLPTYPPVVGRAGIVIGFGRVELKKKKTDAEVPCILQKTSQAIEHPDRCRHVHKQVVSAFCTRSNWRPDSMACRGDSGGPWLVSGPQGYEVQGLSSFGAANCKPDSENDHYTNVYLFVPWIRKIIHEVTNGSADNPVLEAIDSTEETHPNDE